MRHTPGVFTIQSLLSSANEVSVSLPGSNEWVPARPTVAIGFRSRCRAAWLVFTGRADAVVWPAGQ
jgi:hypothetical protein